VEEYKLFYRQVPEGQDIDNSIEHQSQMASSHGQSSHHSMYGNGFGGSNSLSGNGGYNKPVYIHWSKNDWRDVVLPAVPLSHLYTQSMSYMIRALESDQNYEAKVQAR
jgi:hypothetical protein